jgi:hypothetical protein
MALRSERRGEVMLKKYAGRTLFCATLTLFAVGPAFAGSSKDKTKPDHPRAYRIDTTKAYSSIFEGGPTTDATCIADCGDGTGWQCTGDTVSCTDGSGCTASSGGKTATGSC